MLLCIDDANVEAIRRLVEYYPIDGVSTNPTIISRTKREPFEVLKEIREIIGSERELFAQVLATEADGMLADAKRIIKELGDNTVVKIPCTTEGFKAMKMCHKEGIRLLGTAIYTPMQGFIAAKCGCEYLAPYVNRIDNMGYDGVRVAMEIQDMLENNGLNYCGLLAASFKNSQQIIDLIKYGVKAVTVPVDVFDNFVKNAAIDAAVDQFTKDFANLVGPGKTMSNC